MKYVVIRCEDQARGGAAVAPLLAGARLTHLQQLAKAAAAGTIRPRQRPRSARWGKAARPTPLDRIQLHRAMFGLPAADPNAAPGRCYAASINLNVTPEETVWCCELLTQHEGRVVDATAGQITTRESEVLIHALEDALGSETRRWEVGEGSHHLLIASDPAYRPGARTSISSPQQLIGDAWDRHLPSGALGDSLHALIAHATQVLEAHPINRVRIDLGENPANLLWLWGSAPAAARTNFRQRSGLSGAVLSTDFLLRGLARLLDLEWRPGPAALEEQPLLALRRAIDELSEQHDYVYVHLPIAASEPVERQCAMERIDQLILKPLAQRAGRDAAALRVAGLIDDRSSGCVCVVAVGEGLPPQPVISLSAAHLADSPLAFEDGAALFEWLTHPAASSPETCRNG